MNSTKKSIVNCHTHIFKVESVPPYISKSIIPPPFYLLFSTRLIVRIYKLYLRRGGNRFSQKAVRKRRKLLIRQIWFKNNFIVYGLYKFLNVILFLLSAIILVTFILGEAFWTGKIDLIRTLLTETHLNSKSVQVTVLLISFIVVKPFRGVIVMLLEKIRSLFFGENSKDLLESYAKLAQYSQYDEQRKIFNVLHKQYPPDAKFVVLPMDMEYMDAGAIDSKEDYYVQMDELMRMKRRNSRDADKILPFIFIDPRRIRDKSTFFKYTVENGQVVLKDSFVKTYIEKYGFHGIKIYPALGYYPFDEDLLPLWLYAAERQIPIMTHCIKGTIFYRGPKKMEWYEHPVFNEFAGKGKGVYEPLLLPEGKGMDYSVNFTHPMNYLVLLEEDLLRRWVAKCSVETKALFGFTDVHTPLKKDLSKLKVCLAHFGGEEHWKRYLDKDRNLLFNVSERGSLRSLTHTMDRELSWSIIERHWKHTDWYSIICTMMERYNNVYADISYILYDKAIYGLLSMTLRLPLLRTKVLFGTDYYVVRNHGSEKSLLSHVQENMAEDDFDQIARTNPRAYLSTAFGNIDSTD